MYSMKDSGVEWIGEIPEGWKVVKLKNVASIVRGGSPRPIEEYLTDDANGYNWIKIGDTQKGNKYIESTKQKIVEEGVRKSRVVHKGDLLLTNSMSFGEPYILNIDGCIHDGWVAFSEYKGIELEFLYYILSSPLCLIQFAKQVDGGVVQNLNIEKIGTTIVFMPSLEEQKRIVCYLDAKCAKIDALIAKQQEIIEKLKAYKLSVITEAVTKGLNPNVPMQDSGAEWGGVIPGHWNRSRIAKVASAHNGDRSSNYPSGDDIVDEGVLFVTSNNLGTITLNTKINTNKYITQEKYDSLRGAKMHVNDIVFCLRGSVGKCSINKTYTKGTIASSLVVIRAKKIMPDFLNYVLQDTRVTEAALVTAIGIGSLNLSAENIMRFVIPVPPIEEQEQIVLYLDAKCRQIEATISRKQSVVQKLTEYKKSLIYEVVTGKREVI